jgi:hypothetical protein
VSSNQAPLPFFTYVIQPESPPLLERKGFLSDTR